MEIKSILIKDTTREERIRIVQEGLNQCGGARLQRSCDRRRRDWTLDGAAGQAEWRSKRAFE